jgi:hypothetical protein
MKMKYRGMYPNAKSSTKNGKEYRYFIIDEKTGKYWNGDKEFHDVPQKFWMRASSAKNSYDIYLHYNTSLVNLRRPLKLKLVKREVVYEDVLCGSLFNQDLTNNLLRIAAICKIKEVKSYLRESIQSCAETIDVSKFKLLVAIPCIKAFDLDFEGGEHVYFKSRMHVLLFFKTDAEFTMALMKYSKFAVVIDIEKAIEHATVV